jgi:DNA-binding CsgD family transcriptional regulator
MALKKNDLSKREKEVAELLLQGMSNKQIALALRISESTVEFHLKNVYGKLNVHSRAETILKLGKSTGVIGGEPQESIVVIQGTRDNNSVNFNFKETEMKKRLFVYVLVGLTFGAAYWQYLTGVSGFINQVVNPQQSSEISPLATWLFLSLMFVAVFSVWLIPTIFPAVYEFRRSEKVTQSALAVIVTWVSAVLGYYLTYLVLLAFVGLPNLESLLVFGEHSATFLTDWGAAFNKLILFHFLKWTVVGTLAGGFAGLVTSSIYSVWTKRMKMAVG